MGVFLNVTYISIFLNKEFRCWKPRMYCLAIRHTKSETKTGIYRFWASHLLVSRFWEKVRNSKPYSWFELGPKPTFSDACTLGNFCPSLLIVNVKFQVLECLYRLKWSQDDGLGVLVITPTRELAYQIYEVLRKIGKFHDFSAGLVIGGKVCDQMNFLPPLFMLTKKSKAVTKKAWKSPYTLWRD